MMVGDEVADLSSVGVGANRYRTKRTWFALLRDPSGNIVLVFIVVQLACLGGWLLYPNGFRYLDWSNIETLMRAIPLLGVVAIGVGVLMICGEFDLSVGATFILTSYLMALAFNSGWPLPAAILSAFAAAAAIGLGNGLITVMFKIPSFITTLGSMMFLRGVVRFVSGSQPIIFHPGDPAETVLAGSIGFVQAQFVWFVLFVAAGYLLLVRHRFGNHVFMVGGNRKAAIGVGVSADRVKVICFVLCAVCAAFAGIMSAVRVSAITPTGGVGLELQAIAACVVGGLSLNGGRGTVIGIALGASLLFTIQDVLLLVRAPGYYLDMFVGAIIVVAVILNHWVARRV